MSYNGQKQTCRLIGGHDDVFEGLEKALMYEGYDGAVCATQTNLSV